jgi:hypothetical protein
LSASPNILFTQLAERKENQRKETNSQMSALSKEQTEGFYKLGKNSKKMR